MNFDAEIRRLERVWAANEALKALGIDATPRVAQYHHQPDCPKGERCYCSQRWIRL